MGTADDDGQQPARPVSDSLQISLAQLIQQLTPQDQDQAAAAPLPADQERLISSQAAALASARQAMQLMVQLMQSDDITGASMQSSIDEVQQVGPSTAEAMQTNIRQLIDTLSAVQLPPQDPAGTDAQAVMTSQAADLAAARQAMQLMLQLLEQSSLSRPEHAPAAEGQLSSQLPQPQTDATATHIHQQLREALAEDQSLSLSPAAALEQSMQTSIEVRIAYHDHSRIEYAGWMSCVALPRN